MIPVSNRKPLTISTDEKVAYFDDQLTGMWQ